MSRKAYNRLIGALLVAGATVFLLLLAGVASDLLTQPRFQLLLIRLGSEVLQHSPLR